MVEKALKIISPLQGFLDNVEPTHGFLLNKALIQLQEKNYKTSYYERYYRQIYCGLYAADKGWQNVTHYFNPRTKKGLFIFLSAKEAFYQELKNFHKFSEQKNPKAFWHFGRAAHILQDLCEPHHLKPTFLNGHKKFERWVGDNIKIIIRKLYLPPALRPWLTLEIESFSSKILDYYELVGEKAGDISYFRAAQELLAAAVKLTMDLFLENEIYFRKFWY
ncbi:zinc dependent phospholipase C family protein [Carboxydothermus hydrogenoformans]|uniref:Phospholipase C n=1 Tax=Carboxydothermus hydrogenoformans (strain ATCC BAA-161 / DSM 6008 / Z-2901) TaxID=246194 RepID=Q3AE39_CARHZ|nr:hypothetical protein [Carboxydothermus hydrogenoformans]ABB14718.1 hypothetical protein CHY_0741 [Carboxydothermus hydrogenoformans Z-2901]